MSGPMMSKVLKSAAAIVFAVSVLLSAQAQAQSIVGKWVDYADPEFVGMSVTFEADGGWSASDLESTFEGCPGPFIVSGSYTASGGSISMTIDASTYLYWEYDSGKCVNKGVEHFTPYSLGTGSYSVSGRTLEIRFQGGELQGYKFALTQAPFVATTTSLITATSATISTRITFNAPDAGRQGSVFVTSWAPVDGLDALGISAAASSKELRVTSTRDNPYLGGAANTLRLNQGPLAELDASAFVLVQLTAASGWQLVENGQLIPYASGVLDDSLAAQSILNNTNPANLKGAQFCLGYGLGDAGLGAAGAAEMIAAGRMLPVATIPDPNATGTATGSCIVGNPATGIWWNPAEGGRGFVIEKRGNTLFLGVYLYDDSGRSTWHAASGAMNGNTFSAALSTYANGQTLTGPYVAPVVTGSAGDVSIIFTDSSHGTLTWPGGTIPIERFDVVTGGAAMTPPAGTPETGIWWNPAESGRGFALEIQGGTMFLGGYMFDASGNPIWYLSGPTLMTDAMTYVGVWEQLGNGQTMTGTYTPATVVNANVGTVRIDFSDTENATLTLPDGGTINITRFRF